MRTSVNDPNTPDVGVTSSNTMSDYASVDDTPGALLSLGGFGMKIIYAFTIVFGVAALSFPYLFPRWAENYKKQLSEMGTVANTGKFFKNAHDVDWKAAFSKQNLKSLMLVGTGRHPQLKANPGLKAGVWFTGEVFIMKDYVTEKDFIKFKEGISIDNVPDSLTPATNVDFASASVFCKVKGGRIPTWEEISYAYWLVFTKKWQGKTGDFFKPNLRLSINKKYSVWTSTAQGDGYATRDNFRIFTPGKEDSRYEDDSFDASNLGFICVKDVKE